MFSSPSKFTNHRGKNKADLKAAVSASIIRDLQCSHAEEKYRKATQQYKTKREEISELEAKKVQAQQRKDDEIQKAEQQYEAEINHIDRKILLSKKDLDVFGFKCSNGLAEVHSAERRAHGARVDVLLHNGGVQKAADIIVAHTLNSPMQGLGIHPTHQSFSTPPAPHDHAPHDHHATEDMCLEEIYKAELDAVAAHTASIIENGGLQKLADTIMNEELAKMEAEFALSRRKGDSNVEHNV